MFLKLKDYYILNKVFLKEKKSSSPKRILTANLPLMLLFTVVTPRFFSLNKRIRNLILILGKHDA
jgi:hypothetical protein